MRRRCPGCRQTRANIQFQAGTMCTKALLAAAGKRAAPCVAGGGQVARGGDSRPVQCHATSSTRCFRVLLQNNLLPLPEAKWQPLATRQVAALHNRLISRPAAAYQQRCASTSQAAAQQSQPRWEPCTPCQAAGAHLQRLGGGVLQLGGSHPAGGDGAELSILSTDGQGQLGREGVGHRMERLHRGQAPVLQVSPDFSLQPAGELRDCHNCAHSCRQGPSGLRLRSQQVPLHFRSETAQHCCQSHVQFMVTKAGRSPLCRSHCTSASNLQRLWAGDLALPLAHRVQAVCALHTAASWPALYCLSYGLQPAHLATDCRQSPSTCI